MGKNRDVIIVKNDGIRTNKQYSVIIISSKNPDKSFRCDDDSLIIAMKTVLGNYVASVLEVSHGQPVSTNGKTWITPDQDSHNGGVWKMNDSEKSVGKGKDYRIGSRCQ